MANTSLTILPSFHLPRLLHLNMSSNKLTFVPSTALGNMTTLRTLDLSNNYLPNPPHNVWHIMPRLRFLSLAYNPIRSILNESFLSLDRVEKLDISFMDIESVEMGTFGTMPNLKDLKLSVGKIPQFNLAELLYNNHGLQGLHVVLEQGNLRHELQSKLPPSLNRITVEAPKMPVLHPAAFKHLTASSLEFSVISEQVNLEQDLFLNLGHVQNLSIDLSGSVSQQNTTVGQIANPSTKYRIGLPNSVFLKDLNLGDKAYPCSCFQIGWIEKWLRRKRGLLCSSDVYMQYGGTIPPCRQEIRNLRKARCKNFGTGLLETLETSLDCLSYNMGTLSTVSSVLMRIILSWTILRAL